MSIIKPKEIQEQSKLYHGAGATLKDVAQWFVNKLDMDSITNLTSNEDVKNIVATRMKANRRNCEIGFIDSYTSKNKDKTLNLVLLKGANNIFKECKTGEEPTHVFDTKAMFDIKKTVWGVLGMPKALVHKYGEAGASLKAFLDVPRSDAMSDVKTTYNRLLAQMTVIIAKQCDIKKAVVTPKGQIGKVNTAVLGLFNLLETLKDDDTIAILKSFDKKYLNKLS
jgi:hypothetical protein